MFAVLDHTKGKWSLSWHIRTCVSCWLLLMSPLPSHNFAPGTAVHHSIFHLICITMDANDASDIIPAVVFRRAASAFRRRLIHCLGSWTPVHGQTGC
jgi:hypothetical protein